MQSAAGLSEQTVANDCMVARLNLRQLGLALENLDFSETHYPQPLSFPVKLNCMQYPKGRCVSPIPSRCQRGGGQQHNIQ